jgi:Cu2+-exporting ATPase
MRKVEKALLEVAGVASARANLSARRATVVFEEAQATAAPLVDALGRVGFKAAELAPEALDSGQDTGRQLLSRLAVAGFAAANIMLLSVSVWSGSSDTGDPVHALFHWLSAVIALPAIAYAGQPFSVQPGKR